MNPRSYSAFVPWRKLVEQLRLRLPPPRLPAITACPFCQQVALQILTDPAGNSHWVSCRRCHWSGDLIELAAAVWHLPIPATILKLTKLGFPFPPDHMRPEAIANYVHTHVEYHHRVRALWVKAHDGRIYHNNNLAPLLQQLGLTSRLSENRWATGPGQLMGCLNKADIEECFCPKSAFQGGARVAALDKSYNPSRGRVFSGRNWKDSLVWPFYDCPGRVRSFLFAGREGRPNEDWVFRASSNQDLRPRREAGLWFHPQLRDWSSACPLLALRDIVTATQLQLAHFKRALVPLPIVSWYADDKHITQQGWSIFANYPLVFFAEQLDADLLYQAKLTEGRLHIAPKNTLSRDPSLFVSQIFKAAKAWPEALSDWLETAQPSQLEELGLQFELRGQVIDDYLERCPLGLRKRSKDILEEAGRCPQVQIEGRIIEERADSWHAVRRSGDRNAQVNDEIVNAVLRIDRVLHDPRRHRILYQGRILFKQRVIDFLVPQDVIENTPFRWMRQLLVEEQAGLLRFSRTWQRHALHIALQFHEPQVLSGPDRLGWDPRQDRIVLPRFSLDLCGQITPTYLPNLEGYPGSILPIPDALSPAEVGMLTRDKQYSHTTFWGFLALAIARVLAPVLAIRRPPAVLTGNMAKSTGNALASLIGCEVRKLGVRRRDTIDLCLDDEDNWLIWVNCKENSDLRLVTWIAANREAGGYFTALARRPALAAMLHTEATLLACREEAWHPKFNELAPKLVSDYLSDVCQRRLKITKEVTVNWDLQILTDLAQFAARRGGKAESVMLAAKDLFGILPGDRAAAFGELLFECRRNGSLTIVPEGFAQPNQVYLEQLPRSRLRISRNAAHRACAEFQLPTLTADDVSQLLDAAGLLKGEDDLGWIVPESWWRNVSQERIKKAIKLCKTSENVS